MVQPISTASWFVCGRRSPPYPIDQDLDELAAQSAELLGNLVWAHGRIIADDPETIARGEESDDVIEFIRGRIAKLKKALLVESPLCVPKT